MYAGRSTLVVIAALVSAAGVARGEEEAPPTPSRPAVAVMGLSGPVTKVSIVSDVSRALFRAAEAEKINVADVGELRTRTGIALPQEELDRVGDLRRRAQEHLLHFDLENARVPLDEARHLLRERFADIFCHPELSEIDLTLAGLLLDVGSQTGTADDREPYGLLLETARCRPDLSPSPNDYGPRLIAAWSSVQRGTDIPEGASFPELDLGRITAAADAAGVAYVVTGELSVSREGSSLELSIVLVRADSQEELARERVTLGSRATWERTLRSAIRTLFEPLRRRQNAHEPAEPAQGRLLLLTTPVGAGIIVDGEAVDDVTPTIISVAPGAHQLSLSLTGYETDQVEVTVWADQTQPIEVSLRPVGGSIGRRYWWAWTLVSVVVAGAAAGLIYWAVIAGRDRPDARININPLLFVRDSWSGPR